ncbi:MAG TPA: hypothetical protein VFZ66_00070 [Herpetosiphonaceae bacterium]
MIPGFGGHYRLYRLAAALDRLRALPPNATISLAKAAHLLGASEAHMRKLVQRYAGSDALDGNTVRVAALRQAIRQAREARKRR